MLTRAHRPCCWIPLVLLIAGCAPPPVPPAVTVGLQPAPEPTLPPTPDWREVSGRLATGETLVMALGRHGVTPPQVHEVVTALEGVFDFRRAQAGASFLVRLDRQSNQVNSFRFENGLLDVVESVRGQSGTLEGRRLELELEKRVASVGVVIHRSLYHALEAAGESPELAPLLADVFAWDIDFYRDQHPGDRFRLLVEKLYHDDSFVRYGNVLAAEYSGRVGTLRTFWFTPDGDPAHGEYFLEDGRSARKFFLATPLKYRRVSSGFSYRRKHPVLGYNKAHLGVDYAAPRGTPVRAMASGTVTFAGRKGASGKLVVIRHGRGLESCYAHLSSYGPGIRRGIRVKQKQEIGRVGATGRATGPHLHFAVKKNGRFVNPQKLKLSRMDPVKPEHRSAFQSLIARRVEQLAEVSVPQERLRPVETSEDRPLLLALSEAEPLAELTMAELPGDG
jgi:murein DD-endopeptidase MepM/ murein hydrolase activator NlpD